MKTQASETPSAHPANEIEPTSNELRRETVSKFVRDVSDGKIAISIDLQKRRQEDIELISSISSKLILCLNDYLSGTKAGEEFEFLEKELLFCISTLRRYGAFKTEIKESKNDEEITRLESKIDSTQKQLEQILTILGNSPRIYVEERIQDDSL